MEPHKTTTEMMYNREKKKNNNRILRNISIHEVGKRNLIRQKRCNSRSKWTKEREASEKQWKKDFKSKVSCVLREGQVE